MAHSDEHADILGGPIRQNPNTGLWVYWSYIPLSIQLFLLAGLGSLAVFCYVRIRETIVSYQELSHRKASRRKHGIPDNDHRPFAVAYRAAIRARAEREAQERRAGMGAGAASKQQPVSGTTRNAIGDAHNVRQRLINHDKDRHFSPLRSGLPALEPSRNRVVSFEDIQPPSRRPGAIPSPWTSPHKQGGRHLARQNAALSKDGTRPEKRLRAGEDDVNDGAKRSRVVGQLSFDDDDSRGWYERSDELLARGSKRGFDADEDDHDFGGDDEEDNVNGKTSRQIKRRSLAQRKLEAGQRGTKRDRNDWSPESDDDHEVTGKGRSRSHKKRGKRAQPPSDEDSSDVSMDAALSKDPLCKGRKIGEQWESKGVQYKVADNGERVRLTLVKKARSKYVMPEDSQHPDRSANMDIYVETWLTEEEYKEAEKRQELIGQDTPAPSSEPQTAPGSPTKAGKSLLWDLAKNSPLPKRSLRQSIASDVGLRVNPFQQPAIVPGRRVGSSNASPVNGVVPSSARFRPFSKWEKQDLEAAAMARMREKMQEQKKAESPALPAPTAPSPGVPSLEAKPALPTITFTLPTPAASTTEFGKPASMAEVKPAETKPLAGFSFGQPPAPAPPKEENKPASAPAPLLNFGAQAPSTAAAAKPTINFGAPPAKEQNAQPSSIPPSAVTAAKEQAFSAPPSAACAAPPTFSFSQPSKPPAPAASNPPMLGFGAPSSSTPATADSSTSRFSFGAPAATTASTTGTPGSGAQKPSELTPASQPLAPFGFPSSGAPKPALGGFGKPPASGPTHTPASNPTQPMSAFGAASTTPAAAGDDKTDGSSQPKFSFGAVAPKAPFSIAKAESTPATTFGGPPQDATKPATPVFAFNNAAPKFMFGQPSSNDKGKAATVTEAKPMEADKPQISFGQPRGSATPAAEAKPVETDKPKFSFGQPGGLAASSTPSAFGAASSSSQPQSSGFSFGGGATNAFSSTGSTVDKAKPSAPTSIFGGGASNANKPDGQAATITNGPTAFGFGSGTTTSAFGQNGASSTTTPATAFGQASTLGGSNAPAPATGSQNIFSYGAPKATPFSATPTGTHSATSGFSFGAPKPATNGSGDKSAEAAKPSPFGAASPATPMFAFGKQPESNSSTTNGSTTATIPSSTSAPFTFGTPAAAPTTFSFGTPATGTSGGSTFTFGQPSNQQK